MGKPALRNCGTFAIAMAIGVTAPQIVWATEMTVRTPVSKAAPQVYNWTGLYVGGNLGYGWARGSDPQFALVDTTGSGLTAFFNDGGFPVTSVNPQGFIGGTQIGYNWQSNAFVWGLAADLQASGMKQGSTFASVPPAPPSAAGTTTLDRKIDWFGTIRGKLGFAIQNWLLYGTGGLAYGHIKEDLTFTPTPPTIPIGTGSNSQTKAGWTVGGGFEYGVDRWSFGVEYLFIDFGRTATAMTFAGYLGAETDMVSFSSRNTVNVVRALVNYHF